MRHCLQELNSSLCFCWLSCLLFSLPFLFSVSQPLAQQSSSFPCFDWNFLPFQLCFTKSTLSLAVKERRSSSTLACEAHAENSCFRIITAFLRKAVGTAHTSSALCKAMASLGLVWCPLLMHPLDLFAFIRTVGNCKGFMRARTNEASQEGIPGGLCCFNLRGLHLVFFVACKYFASGLHFFILFRRYILNSQ